MSSRDNWFHFELNFERPAMKVMDLLPAGCGRRDDSRIRTFGVETLERRELLAATAFVSEVHPAGSGNGTYAADWFEVTNPGPAALEIGGWRVDDNSNSFAASVALRGVTSIPAGRSAVFLEGDATGATDDSVIAAFSNAWFGTPTPPPGLLIGAYGGAGVGLGGGGDAVNLFNAGGSRITGIGFGAANPAATFDNTAGLGSAVLPLPAVSAFSAAGVNGAALAFNGAETGSPGRTITGVDLSTYVRVARYDLPEPTRTAAPAGSLLAREASAVAYNWDTDTLFVLGDGSTSIVQVSKTGQLIDSMTLAAGGSPIGTEFYDTEGLAYVGGGRFVMVEERDRQVVLFTYAAGTTLGRGDTQTVDLGTFLADDGIEGVSHDPSSGGFIAVKEKQPQGVFQTGVDFAAGTATNGSPTTVNSTNLFEPALLGLLDFADVFALSNLSTLNGHADSGHLLVLSQESGRIVNVDRSGNIFSALTIADPGNPLDVPGQQHEGLTMDANGFLYVVSENGGGDADHPQLWVYAPATVANQAPTAVALSNAVNTIAENTSTTSRVKVAGLSITDDGLGTNGLSVTGPDAAFFEVDAGGLFIRAGTGLDFEAKTSYSVTVVVDDVNAGGTPDATTQYTLSVTDVVDEGAAGPSLVISEVAAWSSGSPVGADWFEVTNTGDSAVDVTGWRMDDSSNSFAAAVALSGVTSIAAGESVVFIETADLAGKSALFLSTWFGDTHPAGLQIGSYSGGSVGLSAAADAVNLFDALGVRQAGVTFGASPTGPLATFNNAAGLDGAAVSLLSVAGVDGAFAAANDANQIGSPGTVDNDPPVATADGVATDEDSAVTFDVLANDADGDGDALTVTGFTGVGHGVLSRNGDGSFTYVPAPDFNGSDAFTYTITDGNGRTSTATASITVAAVNDAPVLTVPGVQTTAEDVAVEITGIAVADSDAHETSGIIRVTLSAGSGTLAVAASAAGGLTAAQIAGNGTGAIVLEGAITQVNATLAGGVRYLGSLNFDGTDTLVLLADDLGASGAGGALTDSRAVSVRVLSPEQQIARLRGMVVALYAEDALPKCQANSLLKKLEHARTALTENRLKVAYALVGGFKGQVESFIDTGVMTPGEGDALLSEAERLLLSLRVGLP